MKVLMVSWSTPAGVVERGFGVTVHQLRGASQRGWTDVVVLNRRPRGTDPSTHPSTDESTGRTGCPPPSQAPPHEFDFGAVHYGVDAGHGPFDGPPFLLSRADASTVAPRLVHRPRLAGRTPATLSPNTLSTCPLVSTIHATSRPAGIRAGVGRIHAASATPSNRGWFSIPIRSSPFRRR